MKKRGFDIATLVGGILAFGLIFYSIIATEDGIVMDNLLLFFDPNSIYIVIGGTLGALLMMFPLDVIGRMPKHLLLTVMPKKYKPTDYIDEIVEAAKKARLSGLLSLEETVGQMQDSFMQKSFQMLVDSIDPDTVKKQMESWQEDIDQRHAIDAGIYDKGAGLAPGFGMIGTLIGLVNLLQNLDDIAAVGPGMSVALITTLYGSLLANAFFIPIATKLRARHDEEMLCLSLISVGVEAIQEGLNPNIISERLLHMLPEYKRSKASKKMGAAAESGAEG